MVSMAFKKVFHTVLVIFAVSTFVFWFLRISGDPVALLMPMDAQKQDIEELRKSMGLDDPQYIQYMRFLKNLGKGELGNSFHYKQPAMELLVERMPATFELTFSAMLFAIVIGIPLGIISAVKQGTALDMLCVGLATIGQSVPLFWLGLMLMLVFSVFLGILPTSGRGTYKQLILPTITLGALPMAAIVRLLRASMLTALHMDYVTAARAKGVREFWVVVKHAFRNAAIPVVTFIGLQFGMLFGGAVVTEIIFAWPGVGRLVVLAIYNRDYPLVQATVIFLSTMFVTVNFIVDLLYSLLDPRVRVGGTK
jgi:ABC-type dipeptide/oligopeptide/nickel transport system permease component